MSKPVQLTKFSHGGGCGCKIAPSQLETLLKGSVLLTDPKLLVGNESKDDAAAYEIENGRVIISTTDFFTPIVDEPEYFGKIAAANAISDVYAMGGRPLLAIAILGWPVDKIPMSVAGEVLDGARAICKEAGIPLAGGHSIDIPEPVFGLAVTGECKKEELKKNSSATANCLIYLTKPIGVGIISTANKRGKVQEQHYATMVKQMCTLNKAGEEFGKLDYVKAMTDVTGFGLLGHLIEMCEGSQLSAELEYRKIPMLQGIDDYINAMIYPDITFKNWKNVESKVKLNPENQGKEIFTLCDPQTNGGLLIAVDKEHQAEFENLVKKHRFQAEKIGVFKTKNPILVAVK